ncbi:MAG TPA: histidinol-phosphate transaminase [Cytophagales bacterium]|nr:histidinol-phosphate transaminase [Cytophagales bacterium]HAA21521.1 histidinol-phosphate transaminase [Cytophagales bacterium]
MFDLNALLRPHIRTLKPYSSARDEFSGSASIFLDANENPFGSVTGADINRYPDPLQRELKELIAPIRRVVPEQIFLGNGSDEAIDLLYRAFCNPGQDEVIILPPTYGMYRVSADLNDVRIKEVPLIPEDFRIDVDGVLEAITEQTKMIFICSPNNPTGNAMRRQSIEGILKHFNGLVVLDEAYSDFSPQRSFVDRLNEFPNLIVLQTFSKAWGMAAIRLGMAFASQEIVQVLNRIKPPYNISGLTQQEALEGVKRLNRKETIVKEILKERAWLGTKLKEMELVEKVYNSDANFILIKVPEARKVYEYLVGEGIIVRDRSQVALVLDCLRITVGTSEENKKLLKALKAFEPSAISI